MELSVGKLHIRCIAVDANYSLSFDGLEWVEHFSSIQAALRRAGELVVEETIVTVYDSAGQGIVVTTLFPVQLSPAAGPNWAEKLLEKNTNGSRAEELKTALATIGLRGAVQFLNSLTPHRFTSVFRFDDPTLRKVAFYDRENPALDTCTEIPVEASYCIFVRNLAERFVLEDSTCDERVTLHAKRDTLKRYCGVPMLDETGKMFGSICHFDFEPGQISDGEVELLERFAELLRTSFKFETANAALA